MPSAFRTAALMGSSQPPLSLCGKTEVLQRVLKERQITDLPTQTLTAWMTLKPWDPLSITLSEEARSSSYSNSDGSQKAAGFAITHLRADYAIGHGFSVNASVNNLFDTQYVYSEGFIEEGRNYWAGIEYQF